MLPFLDPGHMVSVIIQRKGKSDLEARPEQGGNPENADLEMAMEDLLRGIEKKSPKAMAEAFYAAFEVCESYPEAEASDEKEGE